MKCALSFMDPGCRYILFKNKILPRLKLAEKFIHGARYLNFWLQMAQKPNFWSKIDKL